VARILVDHAWRWLAGAVDRAGVLVSPSRRNDALESVAAWTAAMLACAAVIGATDPRDEVLAVVVRDETSLCPT
jgi:hypothetical protein